MQAYYCAVCGYLYDDETADLSPEGKQIPFEELEIEWACPVCGASAEIFLPIDSERITDRPA